MRRLGPDDVAIIDHTDLDRVSAEELLESGVRVVVNVAPSQTGRFPNPGPLAARARRRPADRRARARRSSTTVRDGELLTVRGASVFRNGDVPRRGPRARARTSSSAALAEQRGRVTEALEAFADNTMRYLREEGRLLAEGIDFPALETRFRDRHALVVARGPGHKRDLRIVRPYIRDFKPVLVAVDGGADALLEAGYRPDVIVGDMDSVSDEALRSAPSCSSTRTRTATRRAPSARERLGLAYEVVPRDGDQRGPRAAARLREGRRADRRGRHALQPDRVPRAQPRRHVVDVPDAAEGGGDPRRREGRLAARQPAGRRLAARRVHRCGPRRDRRRGRRPRRTCAS